MTHPPGTVTLPSQPGWDQVVYADHGVVHVRAASAAWTVAAHRALCVPDGSRVDVRTPRRTAMRCVYTRTEVALLDGDVRVVDVSPLLRELVLHVVERAPITLHDDVDAATVTLLRDQLRRASASSLHLPLPVDARAAQLAERILADPALPLHAALDGIGASRRTLERLMRTETGLTLAAWQRRARMLAAIALLADQSVTRTAVEVGYATPSAFVAAFRSELGTTPRAFVAGSNSTTT